MNMTHYMELLAVNQPWNLIIFMAIFNTVLFCSSDTGKLDWYFFAA